MPTIINGCGTWYCGKRRIHRVKATCSSCGGFGELESYDTTLCFVVFMIPVIPLSQKRILESCPFCQRHRIVSLKQWEASKAKAFNEILEELKADPDNRETIQTALGLATAYQDEALFDKLADALAGHRTDDAEIQAQLGGAYEYFSRWSDAETAYTRALNIQPDNDEIRERLAVTMLKQYRPEEAARHIQHVFESKDPDKAWLTYWLVDGFMAKGLHEEALRIMDVRDELFPKLARDKAYRNQRKNAEKNKHSGKPVRSTVLAESSKAGFREGSGLGFKWPKYVAIGLFLSLLALYLGICVYRGQNRPVYLVNGWTKPYTVKLNRDEHQLKPGQAKKITIPEGAYAVEWSEGDDAPQKVVIETGFFGRPFNRPVFVINPDQLALIVHEKTVYTTNPDEVGNDRVVESAKSLHRYEDVDYEFEPFPTMLKTRSGTQKTRVGLVDTWDTQGRLASAFTLLPRMQFIEYLKLFLNLIPEDGIALSYLAGVLQPNEMLDYLRPKLAHRPILVESHRIYQSFMEVTDPTVDLKPKYRELIAETKGTSDAIYLLARLEDGEQAAKLYSAAAQGNLPAQPPSARACGALSYRHLSCGEFDVAIDWALKAIELDPANPSYRQLQVEALLAAAKYAEILKATPPGGARDSGPYFRYRLAAHIGLGEQGAAEAEINRLGNPGGNDFRAHNDPELVARYRQELDLFLAEIQRDRIKYLGIADKMFPREEFVYRLLRGEHRLAAATHPPGSTIRNITREWESEVIRSGLLYLAGMKAKDDAFAKTHWQGLVDALGKGDREARYYSAIASGKQRFDLAKVKSAPTHPEVKRVILAAFARKYAEHAGELDALAKKLDFDRDAYSLCLRYVME